MECVLKTKWVYLIGCLIDRLIDCLNVLIGYLIGHELPVVDCAFQTI